MRVFEEQRFGPVIVNDELDYHRELRMLEPYTLDLELAGAAPDQSRWRLRNAFRRADGKVACRVTSVLLWAASNGALTRRDCRESQEQRSIPGRLTAATPRYSPAYGLMS